MNEATAKKLQPDTAAEASRPDAPKPPPLRPIEQNRLLLAHASECDKGSIWSATLHAGTPFDNVTKDEFWANKAKDMHVGDKIWIATDDEKYDAELRVIGLRTVGPGIVPNRVSVAVLRFTEITPPEHYVDIGDHVIEFRGQHLKWCVIRRGDKSIAREGCATQEEAERHRRGLSLGKTKP